MYGGAQDPFLLPKGDIAKCGTEIEHACKNHSRCRGAHYIWSVEICIAEANELKMRHPCVCRAGPWTFT